MDEAEKQWRTERRGGNYGAGTKEMQVGMGTGVGDDRGADRPSSGGPLTHSSLRVIGCGEPGASAEQGASAA
jgi:hypothetical protein